VVQQNLPNLWHSLEFDLSIKNILHIKDCTLPFAGIVLGKPSSLKTVGIEMFRRSRHTFYTDKFTSKSFVSHNTGVPKEQLVEIDLLPKIKNRCFLTPELAPIFAARDEDLTEILGTLTRVLDGHGYESDSGAHGHRGYNERMMFVWIGAAVDIPFKVHKLLTTLGPKLYFLRVPKVEQKSDDNYYQQLQDNDFDTKRGEIQQALTDYHDWFEACPAMVHDDKFGSTIRKMPWISDSGSHEQQMQQQLQQQKDAYMQIIKLGKLLAHLRGVVPTWHTQDTQGSEYGYGLPIIEQPDRAMLQLANLARGHALLTGRNYATVRDIPLIIKVVLSTAPLERVSIFDILLANKGILSVNQITEYLNVSEPTARRTMTELKALGLVNMQKADVVCNDGLVRNSLIITLKEQFNWFLTDEFKTLREGFIIEPTISEEEGEQQFSSSNSDDEDIDADFASISGAKSDANNDKG
jgi:DNA-binding transcriptional ArsR family regulator